MLSKNIWGVKSAGPEKSGTKSLILCTKAMWQATASNLQCLLEVITCLLTF